MTVGVTVLVGVTVGVFVSVGVIVGVGVGVGVVHGQTPAGFTAPLPTSIVGVVVEQTVAVPPACKTIPVSPALLQQPLNEIVAPALPAVKLYVIHVDVGVGVGVGQIPNNDSTI